MPVLPDRVDFRSRCLGAVLLAECQRGRRILGWVFEDMPVICVRSRVARSESG